MVAMAPGTVAVVEQVNTILCDSGHRGFEKSDADLESWWYLQVADEEAAGNHQLMVVNADGDLSGEQVMVVEQGHELEALTVLTQDDNTHHFIVYVEEQTVEFN